MPDPKPKPKKVGRPALPKGSAKAETLRIRVTPAELRTFAGLAKARKQTVSEWDSQHVECSIGGFEGWKIKLGHYQPVGGTLLQFRR